MVALDVDGHVWTWGYNGNGQLSDNSTTTKYQAVQAQTACCGPLGGITQIVTGGSFGMALARDGVLWAWGNNGSGQLGQGNGDTTSRSGATPVAIPWPLGTRDHIDKIAVGSNHAVAHARDTGNIYVWGYNGWGQLGFPQGYQYDPSSPTAMPPSDSTTNITDVGAGTFFTFLIRANKTERKIFAFGDNQSGQLGLNHYLTQTTPALTGF
jgi:alpha-tubulin suppressor-like RCC1 family protein